MDILSYVLGKKSGGGGGSATLQSKSVNITENGNTQVSPDTGYDGLSNVSINTNVQPTLQTKSVNITENGNTSVSADTGYDGLNSVVINTNVTPTLQSKSVNITQNGNTQVLADTGYDGLSSVFISVNVSSGGGIPMVNNITELNNLTASVGDLAIVKMTIPNEYNELTYLQATSEQYINTLFNPYKTKADIKFQQPYTQPENMYVGGVKDSAAHNGNRYFICMYNISNNKFVCANYSGSSWPALAEYNSNINTIIYNDNEHKIYFNDTLNNTTISDLPVQSEYPIYLFANNNQGTASELFYGKIYYAKFSNNENGLYERYMLPCKRVSDNEIGMYDIAYGTFYGNTGTGSFTGGNQTTKTTVYMICEYKTSIGWSFVGEGVI